MLRMKLTSYCSYGSEKESRIALQESLFRYLGFGEQRFRFILSFLYVLCEYDGPSAEIHSMNNKNIYLRIHCID